MNLEEIVNKIRNGLTGDTKADIDYLKRMSEEYKNNKLSNKISLEIGKMLRDILPEDVEKEQKSTDIGEAEVNNILDRVKLAVMNKDMDKACDALLPLLKESEKLEESELNLDDKNCYFRFRDSLDIYVYEKLYKPKKEIVQVKHNFSDIYHRYGYILIELGRIDVAEIYLKKALRWNPVNSNILFELGEVYKLKNDMDSYFKIAKEALKYARNNSELARSYRNLGYYFIEKEKYEEAICCNYLSCNFEENEKVYAELFFITEKTGKTIKRPSITKIGKMLSKYNIQLGVSDFILGIAYGIAEGYRQTGEMEFAKVFYNVVYELTDDVDIKRIIDELS